VLAALAASLVVAAELALPDLARERVHRELSALGEVGGVRIEAFPAIAMLWGSVDHVSVRMPVMRLSLPDEDADVVGRLGDAPNMDITVDRMRAGGITVLEDVRIAKRGERIQAELSLPASGTLAGAAAGLVMRVRAGPGASVDVVPSVGGDLGGVRLAVRDGALVMTPLAAGFEITPAERVLFAERGVVVDGIWVRREGDRTRVGLSARAPA
jgi:hypothetical protein